MAGENGPLRRMARPLPPRGGVRGARVFMEQMEDESSSQGWWGGIALLKFRSLRSPGGRFA